MSRLKSCAVLVLAIGCGDSDCRLEREFRASLAATPALPDLPERVFFTTTNAAGSVWYADAGPDVSGASRYLGAARLVERRLDGETRELSRASGIDRPASIPAHSGDGHFTAVSFPLGGAEAGLAVFSIWDDVDPLVPMSGHIGRVPSAACRAAWSPSSDEFAVLLLPTLMSEREQWELAVFTPRGELLRSRPLGVYERYERASLSWSPDGAHLAVLLGDDFLLVAADDLTPVGAGAPGLELGLSIQAGIPQWSADSSRVAVLAGENAYLFNLDTDAMQPLMPERRIARVLWVADSDVLLLLVEGSTSPHVFGEKAASHTPILVDSVSGEICELAHESRRVDCVGIGCVEGLSEPWRKAFGAWEQ